MTPGTELPEFICPKCHGALDATVGAFSCSKCPANYPIVLGIPDFRVFPDPWLGIADDRLKAIKLDAIVDGLSFADSVRAYWDITPATPRHLAEHFIRHVLESEDRAGEWLESLASREVAASPGPWLDVGCGTGGLVAAAAARQVTVTGVDIALRWLVIAKRREALAGRTAQLVCANAEYLPFKNESIARVLSLGMLEHSRDAQLVANESRRVLRPGGLACIRTVNRYTMLREPHVQVWGVGLVPRKWSDRYVRLLSDQRYLHHRPLSPREIARSLRVAGFSDIQVEPARLLGADKESLGSATRWAAPLYTFVTRAPVLRSLARWVSPLLEARGIAANQTTYYS